MGRRGQLDLIGNLISIGSIVLDHPLWSILLMTGAVSGVQAIFNGSPVEVFRLTIYNLFDLINFFLTDISSMCLDVWTVQVCLPDILVSAFNIIKVLAFGAIMVKDLLPIYLNYWQTTSNIAQMRR
jgi:hypothetical protein